MSTYSNDNLPKISPVAVGKLLTKHFFGMQTIIPAGPNQVKITFDTIKNINDCITFQLLKSNGYNYYILSSLLFFFFFGVICLEESWRNIFGMVINRLSKFLVSDE